MTTAYHTPIVAGSLANAQIVNNPLGELDAAIGNLSGTLPVVDDQSAAYTYPDDGSVPPGATAGAYGLTATQRAVITFLASNGQVILYWDGASVNYRGFIPGELGAGASAGGGRTFVVDQSSYIDDVYENTGVIPTLDPATYGIDTTGGRVKLEYANGYLQLEYVLNTTTWRYINFEENGLPIVYTAPFNPNETDASNLQLDPRTVGSRIYVVNRGFSPPLLIEEWIFDKRSGVWLKFGDETNIAGPNWVVGSPESGSTGVSLSTPQMYVIFNQDMEPDITIAALVVRDGAGSVVLGNWQAASGTRFNFFPSSSLNSDTSYTISITDDATNVNGAAIVNFGPITTFRTEIVATNLICNGARTCYTDPFAAANDADWDDLQTWDAGNVDRFTLLPNLNSQTTTVIQNFNGTGSALTLGVPTLTGTAPFDDPLVTAGVTSHFSGLGTIALKSQMESTGQVNQVDFTFGAAQNVLLYFHEFTDNTKLVITVNSAAYLVDGESAGTTVTGSSSTAITIQTGGSNTNGLRLWLQDVTSMNYVMTTQAAGLRNTTFELATSTPESYSSCNNPNQIVRVSDTSVVGSLPGTAVLIPCSTIGL